MKRYFFIVTWLFSALLASASVIAGWMDAIQITPISVMLFFPVCAAAHAAVLGINRVLERPALSFVLSVICASAVADAVYMPLGLLEAGWTGLWLSVLLAAGGYGLWRAAERVAEQTEAWQINQAIERRRI